MGGTMGTRLVVMPMEEAGQLVTVGWQLVVVIVKVE